MILAGGCAGGGSRGAPEGTPGEAVRVVPRSLVAVARAPFRTLPALDLAIPSFGGPSPVLGVGVAQGGMLTALASTAAGSPTIGMAAVDPTTDAGATGDAGAEAGVGASCPPEMVLVEGDGCHDVSHECLEYVPNDPAHRCLEFKKGADVCLPPVKKIRMCMDRYEWPGTPGAQPRVLVDYWEAERLCQSVGKRMCDEDEFYLACEGPEHWPYAWGHVRHPSPCNVDRPYVMVDWTKWAQGPAAQLEEAKRLDQANPIGASHCVSPFGVHDIAGNVDEWTTARAGRELKGSLMGGYWGPVQNACRYVTTVHGPEFQFYQIGFRCCANPKDGAVK